MVRAAWWWTLFVLTTAPQLSTAYVYEEELLYDTFPDGFTWGTATAAYQVWTL